MAIDRHDHIYIVDMTARIQVFTPDGTFINKWQTPDHQFGKPTGLSIGNDGNVLVANTHYYEVLIYSPHGQLIKRLGGTKGERPGEFGLVTHAVQDSHNNIYVSEYGEFDRIQKFSPQGEFILQWGGHGSEPGQFIRPQKMAVDEDDHIWVADACNHRIQVFDSQGKLLKIWGKEGGSPGELYYPYDLSWPRTEPSTSASSATIACSDSPATVDRWAAGAAKAANKANSTTPGHWSATAKA